MTTYESLLWQTRAFVYQHFADTAKPPGVEETAGHFNIDVERAAALYRELHDRHAFLLQPDSLSIRMANPFSGVPTDFRVHAGGRTYYANCAWDMLGIPAALQRNAVIDAVCTESGEPIRLEVREGRIQVPAEAAGDDLALGQLRIHFPLPFARWYDDLVFT